MNSTDFYNQLINQYPLQKTLRFELKPVGDTEKYIRERNLLNEDADLAEKYKAIKKMIDRYHRKVIGEALEQCELSEEFLEEYYETVKTDGELDEINQKLRKQIVGALTSHPNFKQLFGKEMVLNLLPKIAKDDNEYCIIKAFSRFTSYLTNYHDIRKVLYSVDEKNGTVAYRIIHENLPKHVANMEVYEKICHTDIDLYSEIQKLEEYLGPIDLGYMFSMSGFNQVIVQKGIDIYNQVIGGIATSDGKLKGLNEIVNLWNQSHTSGERLPKFTVLYKQMLTESETMSFIIDSFETDEEVLVALKDSCESVSKILSSKTDCSVAEVFKDLSQYETSGIFIKNDTALTTLSNMVCGSWNALGKCISEEYDRTYVGKKKFGTEKYEAEKEKELKKRKSYSLKELQELIDNGNFENTIKLTRFIEMEAGGILLEIRNTMETLSYIWEDGIQLKKSLNKDKILVGRIKDYLDSIKKLQAFLKLFQGNRMENGRDVCFYSDLASLTDNLIPFNSLYNKTRNYATKRPFSQDKIKLNFGCQNLLAGWDVNKEKDNLGVLFRKGEQYYVGIMDDNKVFRSVPDAGNGEECYEKMDYKLLPGPNKMLPKVFFSAKGMDEFNPSEEIMSIYRRGTFKKGIDFSLEDCHKLIDFFKTSIEKHEDWRKFEFRFSPTEKYQDISEFYREISEQGYKIRMRRIPVSYINQLVENGQLYLFRIHNKDFTENSKGNLDLQTIYWKMLFDERNLGEKTIYKLNGEAEVFYRKASLKLEETVIHRKGEELVSKNPLNPLKQKTAKWDIVKNKRYTENKFLFHVPVTINFASANRAQLNTMINSMIRKMDEYHVIGIHRGERNLIYVVVMNNKGEILEQVSLNSITSTYNDNLKQVVDYHAILDKKEKERDKERKNWNSIENIKDLKNGYLSQAVHIITKLAVKYNAFIILENLDSGFVRDRQKVEKNIYQNFEKALIQKLNFLVLDKERSLSNVEVPGGALVGYQLTNQFESFAKLGNQSGVLFRVPAWNITNIDPDTGFVSFLYPQYENIEKAQAFFNKFDEIRYNPEKDYFEFAFDYGNFTQKAEDTRTEWTVCTYGKRLKHFRNLAKNSMWDVEEYFPTEDMKNLLNKYGIDYLSGSCMKDDVVVMKDAAFFKNLMEILKLTLQMRNTGFITDREEDYIQSCVMNRNGEFFNSSIVVDNRPKDTDANGAYNIARKGILMIEKIRQSGEEEKVKLSVSNKEWLQYVQGEKY